MTLLPNNLVPALKKQIETVRDIHLNDIAEVGGEASLPAGLARKYPYAIKELKWQYLFPSTSRCQHPVDGYYCRHHLHWTVLTKVLRVAVKKSGIPTLPMFASYRS